MKRIVIAVGLIAAVALLSAAAAGSVAGVQADAETNASFGAEVSSFMQASSAEAEGEVNDGIFVAALERTDDPEQRRALVENRAAELEERQERLQQRQERLDETDPVARYAIAAEVAVGAAELERAANRTQLAAQAWIIGDIAQAGGVNDTALAEIRANASEMRGRAVAEIAGSVGAPAGNGSGPPVGMPPAAAGPENGNESESPDGGNGNGSNAPADRGGNESEASNESGSQGNDGPPEDAPGNGNQNGAAESNENNGNDSGNGNGGPPEDSGGD
jgi:hypothetical protein